MLSKNAKKELRAAARSAKLRKDFERLRAAGARKPGEPVDLDQLVRFLTDTARMFPETGRPRPFISYTRVLL